MFGSRPFLLDSIYQAPDGKYYYFSLFQLTLSHIRLLHADGSYVELSPVEYFDMAYLNGASPVFSLGNPSGSFVALQFSIGLDSIQELTVYNSDSSSAFNTGNYWGPTLQYVFLRLEGDADLNPVPITSIGYHIGQQVNYSTVKIYRNFNLSGTDASTLNVNLDIQHLFYGGSNPINILNPSEQITSSNPVPALCRQFISNLDSSFSLQ